MTAPLFDEEYAVLLDDCLLGIKGSAERMTAFIHRAIRQGQREALERVRPKILGRTPSVDYYMYEKAKLEFNSSIDAELARLDEADEKENWEP